MTYRGRILAIAALLGLAVLVPTRASAASLVPFQATVFAHYTLSSCAPNTVCITSFGTGQATHLGEVTDATTVYVDIYPADAVNGCTPETRYSVLMTAHGDGISIEASGLEGAGCTAPGTAYDTYVVTGGTGRFQGATGTGTDSTVFMAMGGVGVATTTYSGNLSSPGSLASSR
jgi:hypothetical protein